VRLAFGWTAFRAEGLACGPASPFACARIISRQDPARSHLDPAAGHALDGASPVERRTQLLIGGAEISSAGDVGRQVGAAVDRQRGAGGDQLAEAGIGRAFDNIGSAARTK
jgi:hypothetical protein